jgi:mannitol-specific phosphotransferase system IIBC component
MPGRSLKKMFIIIVIVSLATSFISSYVVLKHKDEFETALADWQSVHDIQDKDMSKIEYNEDGTVATVTLKDGKKFIFRWTEDGWVVEEVTEDDPHQKTYPNLSLRGTVLDT